MSKAVKPNKTKTTSSKKTTSTTTKPKKKYVPKGTKPKKKATENKKTVEKYLNLLFEEQEKPYNEKISSIEEESLKKMTEEEDEVIPYDDSLSTIEEIDEVIPYNDSLSTVEEIDEVIPYDDSLSTIKEESLKEVINYYNEEALEEENSSNEEILEEVEEKKETPKEKVPSNEIKPPTTAFITTGIILTIALSIMVVYLLYKAFAVGDIENIRYSENSNITYTINNIKDNNEVSPKDINTITINTDYNYKTNTISKLEFTYYYLAELKIINNNTKEELYSKNYQLSDPITKEVIDKNDYSLSTSIDIDYKDFLDKSTEKIEKYENASSYLDIYLMINVNNSNKNDYSLSLERKPSIRLSLSDEMLKPEMTNISTEERVFNRPKVSINKPLRLIEGILLAFLTMIILIYTIQLVYDNKKE